MNIMWTAAKKEDIDKDIEYCNDILSLKPDCFAFWNYIKIEPVKWTEITMGGEGNGFWAVAIFGQNVIYYNDIEEGYNCSVYTNFGVIENYYPNQMELYQMVESLYFEISRLRE